MKRLYTQTTKTISKTNQGKVKTIQENPKHSQERSISNQEVPKLNQEHIKMNQERLISSQERPKVNQEGLILCQEHTKESQERPKVSREPTNTTVQKVIKKPPSQKSRWFSFS